jgi:aspartate aminotransferase
VGEPDFDTPDFVKAACAEAMMRGETKYTVPAGIGELREACAAKFNADGVKTTASQVIVTPGGKFACGAAIAAACGPGDEVILPVPYWVSHLHLINASGAKPVLVPTFPENNFELTESDLERYVNERTRMVVLCSPSNPTGAVYRRSALEMLGRWAVEKNFLVMSDEVYEKLAYDADHPHISIGSLSEEINERVVTIDSFSKSYAMTGWRVGFLTAPRWLSAKIDALQTHLAANVTTFAQFGALKALQEGESVCNMMKDSFAKRRDLFCGLLSEIPEVTFIRPSGAFYVFADISFSGLKSMEFCDRLMDEAHIAAAPGCGFGADDFVRFSYACSEDVLTRSMAKFKEFCAALKK